MLLRADLGFLLGSFVSVVVGWFLIRRKWRRMVARNREIKRLIALASEEAARAEFESIADYSSYEEEPLVMAWEPSPQRQLQHQCEVCFSPTTTRCKSCKVVHYCSGKCQVFHWRQGHKDECGLFSSHQKADVGLLQKDDIHTGKDLSANEPRFPAEAVAYPGQWDHESHHLLSGKNDAKIGNSNYGKELNGSVKESVCSTLDECSAPTNSSDVSVASARNFNHPCSYVKTSTSNNAGLIKSVQSELPLPMIPVRSVDVDKHLEFSTSSRNSTTGLDEHLLSDTSTTSSEFWEATSEFIRAKIDSPDESSNVNMQNSRSSSSSCSASNIHISATGFGMNSVSKLTKSTDKSLLSERGNAVCLKFGGTVSSSDINASNTSLECCLKIEESRASLSSVHLDNKTSESESKGHTPIEDDSKVSGMLCSAPKLLENGIDYRSASSDNLKCQGTGSPTLKTSETPLCTGTIIRNHATLDTKSIGNADTQRTKAHLLTNNAHLHNLRDGVNLSVRRVVEEHQTSNSIQSCYSGSRSGFMRRNEGSFSYEHFVQLYNWNKVELRPCGLINCGNSCYANAVLQCLTFTPPLTAYFLQGLHSKTCEKKGWCFTCEFEILVKKVKEGNSPLSPSPVLAQMARLGSHLGGGREEDAHEFLRHVIDTLQNGHLKEAEYKMPSSLVEDTTLVGLTFGGYLRSKIDCISCGGKSEQHERIMDLTVEIGGAISTLEEALQQFTRSEILDGDNKYHCSRCKSYAKAKKKLRILEAPNILTIALKRFQSGQYGKLNKVVKFPEILNLAPYMSGTSDKSPIYRLYGVVVHLDTWNATFSGHYVCYTKNNLGKWFKADDCKVRGVEIEDVLSAGAYMLLYARCSPRFPRLVRSSTAARESRKVKNETCKSNSHLKERWNVSSGNHGTCNDCFYQHCRKYHTNGADLEDDVSSNNSSSVFSDAGSNSTENSNRESTSTDDSHDQIFCDTGNHCNKPSLNSSDSDTSSPSSSPLFSRHSPLSDLDRYSSDAETSGSCVVKVSSKVDRNDSQPSASNQVKEKGMPSSSPHSDKKLDHCCSSRPESDPNRIAGNNCGVNVQ